MPSQHTAMLITTGLAALFSLSPVQANSDVGARTVTDWQRVQALPPGKPTRLMLFKSQAALGGHKLKGVFHAATDSSRCSTYYRRVL